MRQIQQDIGLQHLQFPINLASAMGEEENNRESSFGIEDVDYEEIF